MRRARKSYPRKSGPRRLGSRQFSWLGYSVQEPNTAKGGRFAHCPLRPHNPRI